MIYREVAVPDVLAGSAFCSWLFVMEPTDPPQVQHSIPPDGTTNIVLIRTPQGDLYPRLVGPSLAGQIVPVMQGWSYAGLRLRPEAAGALLGATPQVGTSEALPVEGRFAGIWSDLVELMEGGTKWRGSLALLGPLKIPDGAIAAAVDLMVASGGALSVTRLAARLGLSERQFRRRFHVATGMAPKPYAALQRVRRALILSLSAPNWADIAAETGFADQPHLARDIKERFGAGPRLVAGYFGGIRHELLTPAAGRFVQDPPAEAA